MISIADNIEEFLLDGSAGGWAAGTVNAYRWHLARWSTWLVEREVETLAGLTKRTLREWAASLADKWAPSTRKGAVTAVKAFLAWCVAEEVASSDLVRVLKIPRVPERVQRTLTSAEVQALLVECGNPAAHGLAPDVAQLACVRNAALVALLFDSLVRAFELCALTVADVDLDRRTVHVRTGKGGRGRLAPFGGETAKLLSAWLAVRPVGLDRLFVSLGGLTPGAALTVSGLRLTLRHLGERAGVPGVTTHSFRRGGAVACTLNGAPGRLVQLWAGWSDLKMLGVYTRAMEASSATIDVYGQYSPVNVVVKRALTLDG